MVLDKIKAIGSNKLKFSKAKTFALFHKPKANNWCFFGPTTTCLGNFESGVMGFIWRATQHYRGTTRDQRMWPMATGVTKQPGFYLHLMHQQTWKRMESIIPTYLCVTHNCINCLRNTLYSFPLYHRGTFSNFITYLNVKLTRQATIFSPSIIEVKGQRESLKQ